MVRVWGFAQGGDSISENLGIHSSPPASKQHRFGLAIGIARVKVSSQGLAAQYQNLGLTVEWRLQTKARAQQTASFKSVEPRPLPIILHSPVLLAHTD